MRRLCFFSLFLTVFSANTGPELGFLNLRMFKEPMFELYKRYFKYMCIQGNFFIK